jgi:hypothetical protein
MRNGAQAEEVIGWEFVIKDRSFLKKTKRLQANLAVMHTLSESQGASDQVAVLKGHDFSCAIHAAKSTRA